MTALATSQGADQPGYLQSLTNGFEAAYLGAAATAIAAALIAWLTLRRRTTTAPPSRAHDRRRGGRAQPTQT